MTPALLVKLLVLTEYINVKQNDAIVFNGKSINSKLYLRLTYDTIN